MSLSLAPRSAASAANVMPWAIFSAPALACIHVREHDLEDVASFGRDVARLAIVVSLLHVGVGNLEAGRQLARRQHQQADLAILGRAERDLALLEILVERVGVGRGNVAGLGAARA